MKNLIMIFALLVTGSLANAQTNSAKQLLVCGTSGVGLALLTVEKQSDGLGLIKIVMSESDSAETEYYVVRSGLGDLEKRTSATIVAQEDGGTEQGGSLDKAILLRVVAGQKRAFLAKDGLVHKLVCTQQN